MIIRALQKQNVRFANGSDPLKVLAKQTHLHLEGHRITRMGSSLANDMRSLETLYLYDNQIRVIEGLSRISTLTHLYLQNNDIQVAIPLAVGIGDLIN